MRKMKKALKGMMLVFVFMCIPLLTPIKANAYSAAANKLNTNYRLTGNGAQDIYAVASAQLNKRYPEFAGFHYRAWCADFVSACAAAAGVSDVVPGAAAVANLRTNIVKAGGTEYSKARVQSGSYTPVRGDIIIFKSNGDSHVGIVDKASGGKIYYIDGNNTTYGNGNNARVHYSSRAYSYAGFTCIVKPRYKNAPVTNNSPFGYLDLVTTSTGKITVDGWAADMDAPNSAIWVHCYTVKNGNRKWLGSVLAGGYRSDVSKVYPKLGKYHGFHATFNTDLSGTIQVEAYGINVGSTGSNRMLSSAPKSVWVNKDTTSPTISDVQITERSATGYTVTCTVRDNVGVTRVRFPTWTKNGGQDDLIWHEGRISGNKASCRINVSEHKNETNCVYYTHIYADDAAGNSTGYPTETYLDAKKPVISNVEITDISENGYTVICTARDDYSGIDRVQFPTWFANNNPYAYSASWHTDSKVSGKLKNGKYVYRVNTSDYGNQIGVYNTHIYAWDKYGNQSECYPTKITLKKAHKHTYTSTVKKAATCTENGIRFYTCEAGDTSYTEVIPATGHRSTEWRGIKEATCANTGYTGDLYCQSCGKKLQWGRIIEKKDHTWNSGVVTTQPTCVQNGIMTYTCTRCKTTKNEEIPATGHGETITKFAKRVSCKTEGYTGDLYCTDCGALQGIVLPSTVTGIGKQAFYNCKKLRSITINTLSLTSKNVGAQAFSGTYAKAVVKVPAKKFTAYKSLLRAKGISVNAVYTK